MKQCFLIIQLALIILILLTPVKAESTTYVEKRLLIFSELRHELNEPKIIVPESYTRLIIIDKLYPIGTVPNSKRDGFERFFSSKDIVFQAALTTEAGRFKEVTPLIFRRYESARGKGENFTREMTFDDRQFPLFLVTGDPASQVAKFTLDVTFTNKPSTDAAKLSLDFLTSALKAVSPTSAVITTLTAESAEKIAAKVDEGFGQFFSESATEKTRFDIDLYEYKPITLTVYGGNTEDTTLSPVHIIGKWEISFAPSRPSVFSSVECGNPDDKEACPSAKKKLAYDDAIKRPNAVLAFALIDKIGKLGTVLGYLKQQDWWASDLGGLNGTKPAPYNGFCRKIRGAMGEIGLSDTDGFIVAYAVSQSGAVSSAVKTELEKPGDCKMSG
jgi:hypothetical protein